MKRLKWSETAANDLQRIAEFVRPFNPELEQRLVAAIIDRATSLPQLPRTGRLRETDDYGTELRVVIVDRRYRIVYQVSLVDEVEIMQVLDARSDHDNIG